MTTAAAAQTSLVAWHELVEDELGRMPSYEGAALGYVYAHGLSQAETAIAMGVTPAAVAAFVACGMRRLALRITG
jgi:DNA-directed RNA polymerase specialized sigma24 family protein